MNLDGNLEGFFSARSVAVIGASNTPGKWGFGILSILLSKGGRKVYPVNRKGGEVLGLKAFPRIIDIPEAVEFAVVITAVRDTPQALEDCIRKGVKNAIIITGGFAEASGDGGRIERELVELARRGGLRFIGPNCMGHFDTRSDFFTIPFGIPVKPGPVSIITQSGNSGIAMFAIGATMGLGFNKYINTGNEADLHFEDWLEYMGRDESTRVVACYVEGFREGRRLLRSAGEITRNKPVVVFKAGRSDDGARAARSHSAALSGSDVIAEVAFRQSGIIRVDEISELVDASFILAGQPLPRGRRVAILAMGGGLGVVSTDAVKACGLEMARLSQGTLDKLNSILTERWSKGNPVDPGGEHIVYPCIWPLMEDDNVDAVMVVGGIGVVGGLARLMKIPSSFEEQYRQFIEKAEIEELANLDRLAEMIREYRKPVVLASLLGGAVMRPAVFAKISQHYIGPYSSPEKAAKALGRLVQYSEYVRETS